MTDTTGSTILAQTIVAANAAAASALAAEEAAADVASKAPIDSPAFTGVPTAPTAAAGTDSAQLATTQYLDRLLGQPAGVATLDNTGKIPSAQIPPISATNTYVVSSQAAMLALAAPASSFCIRTDLSNAVFVLSALPASTLANWYEIGTSPVLSVAGLTGAISATDLTAQLIAFTGDSGAGGAPGDVPAPAAGDAAANKFLWAGGSFVTLNVADLTDAKTGTGSLVLAASPNLTGVPLAPTASVDTDTGQIASVAFVLGQAGSATPIIDGTAAPGTSTRFARQDHVHPTDSSRAPLVSPTFTGTPASTTNSTATDSSTQIATDAFVQAAIAAALATLGGTFSTGDVKGTLKVAADTGWVLMDDGTIGSATSGGTTRANSDCQNLFELLWNNVSNSWCAVSGGRGGSAASDWSANKTIALPKALGRAFSSAGAGSGLTSRALAQYLGEETHLLTVPEIPSHTHTIGTEGHSVADGATNITSIGAVSTINNTGSTGGGGTHNNMQPSVFVNWMIKL